MAVITQRSTKRHTAAALAERIRVNHWSNADAGQVLGCSEGTIRNRLSDDGPDNQMTVYELLRSIREDGPDMANTVLRELVGYELTKVAG